MMSSAITVEQFDVLSAFLKTNSGYRFDFEKKYILESRLPAVLAKAGCGDMETLISHLHSQPAGRAASALLQAMTINETMFFRDGSPFRHVKDHLLPALTQDKAPRQLNFWCAACSSGQEPYSLAMTLASVKADYPGWSFRIFASDLSEDMLARACEATYSDFEVARGLSDKDKTRYFTSDNGLWRVNASVRSMVEFAPVNLLQIPRNIGSFDVILCRNVLIYFDAPEKSAVLTDMRKFINPNGYLIVGATEMLSDLTQDYKLHPEWKGVYAAC